MERNALQGHLERHLMLFHPEDYLPRFVRGVKDIYLERASLRLLPPSDYSVGYLAQLLLASIRQGVRFRTLDSLKVLRAVIRNERPVRKLSPAVVSALFELYQHYISSNNESVQSCVNSFIKDQVLQDEQIKWLVQHWRESNHIVNRLLRYPERHELVTKWALDIYNDGDLQERLSEVLALLIETDGVSIPKTGHGVEVVWAIYRARIDNDKKEQLLRQCASVENAEAVCEVAVRTGIPSVIEHLLALAKE